MVVFCRDILLLSLIFPAIPIPVHVHDQCYDLEFLNPTSCSLCLVSALASSVRSSRVPRNVLYCYLSPLRGGFCHGLFSYVSLMVLRTTLFAIGSGICVHMRFMVVLSTLDACVCTDVCHCGVYTVLLNSPFPLDPLLTCATLS